MKINSSNFFFNRMQNNLQIAVINADGSKRPAAINSPTKLARELSEVINNKLSGEFTRLITVTEFNRTAANGLNQRLPLNINFYGGKFQSGDYTATFYENNVWRPVSENGRINVVWSYPGKYCGVVLENETLKKTPVVCISSLPNKEIKIYKPR